MATLAERVDREMVRALKARDTTRLATLRLLKTAATNAQVAKRSPLTEEEYRDVVIKQAKLRREAAEEYARAGRGDLADQERAELAVLEEYLPAQLGDAEIREQVDQAIAATGATGPADLGQVMARVMPGLRGLADGSRVNRIAREQLASRS
jgi:uncharacterized protein YqeY